jgi:hypothetical protein
MSRALGVPELALCAHQVHKVTAQGSLIGDAVHEGITAGLDWLVRVIDGDFATLQDRIAEQTETFKAADTARREAAAAKAKANLAARAATAAAEEATIAAGAAVVDDTGAQPGAAASEAAPAAPAAPKPRVATPLCFVQGCGQPAVRRAQAAGWQAVCDACGDVLLALPVGDLKLRLAGGEASTEVLASLQTPVQAEQGGGSHSATASSGAAAAAFAKPDPTTAAGMGAGEKPTTPREGGGGDAPTAAGMLPARGSDADSEPTPSTERPEVMPSGHDSDAGDATGHTEDEVTIISPGKAAAAAHSAPSARSSRGAAEAAEDLVEQEANCTTAHATAVPGAVESPTNH